MVDLRHERVAHAGAIVTGGEPRILHLLPFPPRADTPKGGTRVAAELVSRLAERSPSALVYLRGRGEEPPLDEELRGRCELAEEVERMVPGEEGWALWRRRVRAARAIAGRTPRWVDDSVVPAYARRVREIVAAWRPDLVHVHYTVMGQYLPALADTDAPRVLVVYEPAAARALDDVRHTEPRSLRRLARRLDAAAWTRFERNVLRAVDAATVFTDEDRRAIESLGAVRVVVAPFGVAIPRRAADPVGFGPDVLFFGNFTHFPNVDAARRLARAIFPAVRTARPDATLTIAGPGPPDDLRRAAGDGVEVTGEVPDLAPLLDRAAVVALPLRVGAGMRVKALEALAAGKAVVASARALEGVPVGSSDVARAESDDDFARAIAALLADPDRRRTLAERARAWAVANVGWEQSIAAFEGLHASLLGRGRAPA